MAEHDQEKTMCSEAVKELTVMETRSVYGDVDLSPSSQTKRGLKSRQIQFIALGGAIGMQRPT